MPPNLTADQLEKLRTRVACSVNVPKDLEDELIAAGCEDAIPHLRAAEREVSEAFGVVDHLYIEARDRVPA